MASPAKRAALALVALLGGCKRASPEASTLPPPVSDATPGIEACDPEPPAAGGAIRWYEDDLPAALACAKRLGRPVVIDLWAPWCHTCLSMQQTVLAEDALAKRAEDFVWVALDTDREENASAVDRYPPLAWPTFYVVEPASGGIAARHVGGASLEQVLALLEEGERAAGALGYDAPPEDDARRASPTLLVREAAEAEAEADWLRAAELYAAARKAAEPGWARLPDVLVSNIRALSRADRNQACVTLAAEEGLRTGASASAADFSFYAHRCARALDLPEAAKPTLERLAEHVAAAVDAEEAMSADDRSDALRILREIMLSLGRPEAARAYAERQRALLDEIMSDAEPDVVMTHSWPAAEVYTFLGQPEALVPRLEKNVAALPAEYDPPYRLAGLLLEAERPKDALRYARMALDRVYGPRKAQVFRLLARVHAALGDDESELEALEGSVRVLEELPEGQRDPARLRAAREALEAARGDGAE